MSENILQKHRVFSTNLKGRDFIIGDLHGQLDYLNVAMNCIDFDKSRDRLFSVGDLIDRGSYSKEIIELVVEQWFYPVYGNHEQLLIQCFDNDVLQKIKWFPYGGAWWAGLTNSEKLKIKNTIVENYYLSIELETLIGSVGIVHADVPPNLNWGNICSSDPLSDMDIQTLLWSRNTVKKNFKREVDGIKYILLGHTPMKSPLLLGNCIYIDTGSGYAPSNNVPNPSLTVTEIFPSHFHFIQVNNTGIISESSINI
ncbi:MAG: metallophosphoesterase [Colwellia sp.]